MKGSIHALEAIVAAIILISFALLFNPTVTREKVFPKVDLDENEVLSKNMTYLSDTFSKFYPLQSVSFILTNYSLVSGNLSDDTFIDLSELNFSQGTLSIWFEDAKDVVLFENGKELVLGDFSSELIRRDIFATAKNITLIGFSLDGHYSVLLTQTFGVASSSTPINYFYYGDLFTPTYLGVSTK